MKPLRRRLVTIVRRRPVIAGVLLVTFAFALGVGVTVATKSVWSSTARDGSHSYPDALNLIPQKLGAKDRLDANGWPINPRWLYQQTHSGQLPQSFDVCDDIDTKGTFNWMTADLGIRHAPQTLSRLTI
jgi:hypothetical protein